MPGSTSPIPRVRVLWLIKGLGPGGAEQLLLLAAKVADHQRFEYRVAYVRPDKTHLVPEFEALGVSPVRLGARRPGRLGWLLDLRDLLGEVDVVHSHSPVLASVARVLAWTLPRRRRPAMVATEHNEWTSHRRATRVANGVTGLLDAHRWAVSQQVLDTMWPLRRRRNEVLIHGIDTSASRWTRPRAAGCAPSWASPTTRFSPITVANLRRNKDYPNLLHAAAAAHGSSPACGSSPWGQGPLGVRDHGPARGRWDWANGFRLLGFRRDVRELMAASDLFVLGSAHEGLPVAIMEAFAAGLPVVATRVGGVPQQVREGREGLTVPPRRRPGAGGRRGAASRRTLRCDAGSPRARGHGPPTTTSGGR